MADLHTIHWRRIEPSYGGTYKLRIIEEIDKHIFDPNALPAIGTSGCHTGVGVYFKLSKQSCFSAHINAAHMNMDAEQSTPEGRCLVTVEDGSCVREETTRRLEEESKRAKWPSVGQIDQVVLVCPSPHDRLTGLALAGSYIVDGIRDFLKRRDLQVITNAETFLVKHATGEVTFFHSQQKGYNGAKEIDQLPLHDNNVDYVSQDQPGSSAPLQWLIDVDRVVVATKTNHRRSDSAPAVCLKLHDNTAGESLRSSIRRSHSLPCLETLPAVEQDVDEKLSLDNNDSPLQTTSRPEQTVSTLRTRPSLPPATTKPNNSQTPAFSSSTEASSTTPQPPTQAVPTAPRGFAPRRSGPTINLNTGRLYPGVVQYRIRNRLCLYGGEACAQHPPHSTNDCPLRPQMKALRAGEWGRDRVWHAWGQGNRGRVNELRGRAWRGRGG